jgi:GAF domain-containing protein
MSFTPQDTSTLSKAEKYVNLLKDAEVLIDRQADTIANMANISRLIYDYFQFHWVGFYRAMDDKLVLGPYHGPIACTLIEFNKGVCGAAYSNGKTQIVADVNQFPGHIACSALSKSEIVVPCFSGNKVVAVLDIDSDEFATFDEMDKNYLEKLVKLL